MFLPLIACNKCVCQLQHVLENTANKNLSLGLRNISPITMEEKEVMHGSDIRGCHTSKESFFGFRLIVFILLCRLAPNHDVIALPLALCHLPMFKRNREVGAQTKEPTKITIQE